MTAASNQVVAVIQADRDMVQAFHRLRLNKLMEAIKDEKAGARLGEDEGDAGDLVQAFARHRIAHSDPRLVAEGLRQALVKARNWLAYEPVMGPSEAALYKRLMAQINAALATHSPAPMAGEGFVAVVGLRRQEQHIDSVAELLRLINGGAQFISIRAAAHPSTQEGADRG